MKSAVDSTYQRYRDSYTTVPINVQQDLHLYLCVRFSGYLEQLLHMAICAYVSDTSGPVAKTFALSWFKNAPNLNPGAFEKLIGRLSDAWTEELKEFLDKDANRDLLGTLLKIRNDTAHGKSYGGGLANIKSYKELIDNIHQWVHQRLID
ncbi:HEPN domain-containing protein [Lentzea aerocolonigenes]|nr:HEPN domain-containing protein [Lentzea aerocolonigenes]